MTDEQLYMVHPVVPGAPTKLHLYDDHHSIGHLAVPVRRTDRLAEGLAICTTCQARRRKSAILQRRAPLAKLARPPRLRRQRWTRRLERGYLAIAEDAIRRAGALANTPTIRERGLRVLKNALLMAYLEAGLR